MARRLRARARSGTPVLVAITGYGQDEDRKRSREAGFAAHLTKPFDPHALQQVMGATCAEASRGATPAPVER